MEVITRLVFPLTSLFLAAILSFPTVSLAKNSLSSEQTLFLEAEKQLKSKNLKAYQSLKSKLINYPLYPYLEFQELRQELSHLKSREVEQFFDRYEETPLASRMRRFWLKELAKRKQWWIYLTFYRPGMGTKLDCHQLTALLDTGHTGEAFARIPDLWLVGKSQPDACNPGFKQWQEAGKLTTELVWQRIELAMDKGELTLARFLKRYLPENDKKELDLWLLAHSKPAIISDTKRFTAATPHRQAILLHGFKRLVRKDYKAANKLWPILSSNYPFSDEQRYQGERRLLLKLADKDHPGIIHQLDKFQPKPTDERFHTSRLRYALDKQAWQYTFSWIAALPETLQDSDRWRYWKARSAEALGKNEIATSVFEAVAKERSYYGFMAADKTRKSYRFDPIPLTPDTQALDNFSQLPALKRARELITLGRFINARREWREAVKDLPPEALQLASKLAQSWGWHDRAIFTLARTGYWDDLELRFPLKHRKKVASAATNRQIDNAWVFAVIRQESAFIQDAHSSAGAMGLMQLMPGTARYIAKKIKHPTPKKQELLNPDTNITLGTAYLSRVYRELGENQVLATAAYNAGPHRVKAWLPKQTLPADIWVETIPFKETRSYTQRVLSYAVIYDQRLGRAPTPLSERMSWVYPKSHAIKVVANTRIK